MSNLGRAIQLAAGVHKNQTDKAGEDYILHPLAVMYMVAEHGKNTMIVAVLHDTFEDHLGSPIEKQGFKHRIRDEFGYEIYNDIDALTRREGETYEQLIERARQRYRSRLVKIKDLTHNMDPRRIPAAQIVDHDFRRWDKYRKALITLERE